MKEIKDYTQEELQGMLTGVMAQILGTQEQLQALAQNRQVIEAELKNRAEAPKEEKTKKDK